MILEEIEFELSKTIGKSIKEIDILWDGDGMEVFSMEFEDGSDLDIKNSKRKTGDDFRIHSDSDLENFKNAEILSFELIENYEFGNEVIDSLVFSTNKGKINLYFENEGRDDSGWELAAMLIFMNL